MSDTLRGQAQRGSSNAEQVVGSDEELLRRIAGGDAAGFENLVQRYGPPAHAVARSLLEPAPAAAAVERLFSDVWQGGELYDPANGGVRSWLMGLMHRRAVDQSQQGGGEPGGPARSRPSVQILHSPGSVKEGARVRSSLERLSSQQRQVVELMYFRGLSTSDVSLQLGIPADVTTARGVAAMRSLRADLSATDGFKPHSSRDAHRRS